MINEPTWNIVENMLFINILILQRSIGPICLLSVTQIQTVHSLFFAIENFSVYNANQWNLIVIQ